MIIIFLFVAAMLLIPGGLFALMANHRRGQSGVTFVGPDKAKVGRACDEDH
jgi:hypothetical protein